MNCSVIRRRRSKQNLSCDIFNKILKRNIRVWVKIMEKLWKNREKNCENNFI